MARRSLKLRLVGLALVWTTVAILIAGLFISALLRQFVERNADAQLQATMIAVMSGTEFDEQGNVVIANSVVDPRFDRPLSGWYWQVNDENGVLSRSRSLWDVELGVAVAEPDGTITTRTEPGPNGAIIRKQERDFTAPGGTRRLRVVVAMPADLIEDEVATIVQPLVLSLALLAAGIAIAIGLQVHFGLQPLAKLGRDLAAVRRGDKERLPDQPYVEIAPVASEINALLAHNKTVIDRARTHVGNLAHGLKTPLSVLSNRLQTARNADGAVLLDATEQMNRLIGHHLRRARSAAISDLLPVFRGIHADRHLSLQVDVDGQPTFAGERQDLDEMLGNLIDNACKWASNSVLVTARPVDGGRITISIRDDGPGLAEDALQAATSRGVRFDESKPGSGLGLSIVDDLARLYGGTLTLERAAGTGLLATLELPASEA
jgi:signal transduction histidine kinase